MVKTIFPRVVTTHYNIELWASNDGQWGGNQNGSGEILLNSWSTYRGTANGESHHSMYVDAQ